MWYNNSEIMAVLPPKESSFRVCVSHLSMYCCKLMFVEITWLVVQYIKLPRLAQKLGNYS